MSTVTIERLGELMRAGDVAAIEKDFHYAADWNTKEWTVDALRTMVGWKVDFDYEAMEETLRGIVEVCKAEVGGGSYRTNCLRMANDALKELASPVRREQPVTQSQDPKWDNLTDDELLANAKNLCRSGCESLSREELLRAITEHFDLGKREEGTTTSAVGKKWWQFWKPARSASPEVPQKTSGKKPAFAGRLPDGRRIVLVRKRAAEGFINGFKERFGSQADALPKEGMIAMFAADLAGCSIGEVERIGAAYLQGSVIVDYKRSGKDAVDDPDNSWDEPCYVVVF